MRYKMVHILVEPSMLTYVNNAWPCHRANAQDVLASIANHWSVREEIHEAKTLIFIGEKPVPQMAILPLLHESPLGSQEHELLCTG